MISKILLTKCKVFFTNGDNFYKEVDRGTMHKKGETMAWVGGKLKDLSKKRGITLKRLSELLSVSRQTTTDWVKGQIPKGHHLIELSSLLEVSPGYFFENQTQDAVSLPLHRLRRTAKLTSEMKIEAQAMAQQYEKFFKEASDPGLVQVLRIKDRDRANAKALGKKLRKISGIQSQKPLDYTSAFHLLSELNIVTIFRYFPHFLKDYAFYCRIHNHRVIFVNNHTNVLDLIFPLLHEATHAIRDEENNLVDDPVEEDFCDMVAHYAQFPDDYVKLVNDTIRGRRTGVQINLLKTFARDNGHSLFGIAKRLKELNPSTNLNVGGADTNLKKEFRTIGKVLFLNGDPRDYIEMVNSLSPLFVSMLAQHAKEATTRKTTEWLGLESQLDGKQAIEELKRISLR